MCARSLSVWYSYCMQIAFQLHHATSIAHNLIHMCNHTSYMCATSTTTTRNSWSEMHVNYLDHYTPSLIINLQLNWV